MQQSTNEKRDSQASHIKARLPAAWSKFVKPVIFVIALCTTVGLFALPIIFYFISAYSPFSYGVNDGNAILLIDQQNVSTNTTCNTTSWMVVTEDIDSINCETYTGSLCQPYLSQWNQCLLPSEKDLYIAINNGKTQDVLEEELIQLQALLANYPECQIIAVPFACHYYFPLTQSTDCCTGDNAVKSIETYSATQEDCIHMRDNVCPVPWQLAMLLGFTDMLPDCSTLLPLNAVIQLTSNNETLPQNTTQSTTDSTQSNVSCKDGFFLLNNTCLPRCDEFQELPDDSMQVVLISEVVASLIALIVSTVALLLSVIFYRNVMFKFPSIFLLFFTVDVFLFAIVVLILPLDRSGLMCSSVNLIEALQHPTAYCIISGVSFQYLFINMATWWLMHLCIFFYEITFPFHAHRIRKIGKMKYLAIILTIIGFLIPLPGVMVSLIWKDNQYGITRFPPTVCVGGLWFYTLLLPFNIGIGLGVCILITVLWIIHKGRQYSENSTSRYSSVTTAEKKIMIVFVCFVCFGVFSLIHYSIRSGNLEKATNEITDYFLCESTGYVPGKCDRSSFERYTHPYLNTITFIFMGIIPIAVLNFIVNWDNLLRSINKKIDRLRGSIPEHSIHEVNFGETSITRLTSVDRIRIITADVKEFDIRRYSEIILETPV